MEPLEFEQFKGLVRACRRAWHVELRDTYNVAGEDEPFAKFLAGQREDAVWLEPWLSFVREVTASGTLVQRARIVTVPHGDYTRWGFAVAPSSISAGEDIRYLPRGQAADISFPSEDYWLLDEDNLVLSVFSADGRTGGFALEGDPELTAQCRKVRDEVWARAVPFHQYPQ